MSAKSPDTPEPEGKPLVFLSATRVDNEWRERLRKRLDRHADYLEWWDDSKIGVTEMWKVRIDDAIKRASVAVVFLSRAYLQSETTTAELLHLGELTEAGKLRLFPILLEPCEWKQYRFLRETQIWNNATPIGDFSTEAAELELEKIAASIRALFVSPRSTADSSQDQKFSATVNDVLAHAWSLAKQSNRGRITSSCLLFAMADTQKQSFGTTPTPQFVRTALNENGKYEQEFARFLKDGEPSGKSVSLPGIPWRLTENAATTIDYAKFIAASVNDSAEVHTRHLLAALITPEIKGSGSVRDRLKELGLEQTKLCADFRKIIRLIAPEDNPSQWDRILGIRPPSEAPVPDASEVAQQTETGTELPLFRPYYSSYLTDSVPYGRLEGEPLDDSLGVRTYAGHLAQLIAARETPMPLAIGLFGAWGAGKSYFMDLLDEQLKEIATQPGDTFHKHIIPIWFNAWHYLDTNLWANLVSEIFDQLFNSLPDKEDEEKAKLQNLKTELAQQSALAEEAKVAVEQAQRVRRDAENDLREAMKKRAEEENNVASLLNDLPALLDKSLSPKDRDRLQAQLNEVAQGLGLPKLESSFTELQARAAEVHSLAGRTKALMLAIFTGRGWWKRAILLGVALAAPLVVSWLAAYGTPEIKELLGGAGRTIAQIVTAITALSTWLATQVKAGNSLVTKLESAYDKVVTVRTEREAKDDAAKAQAALAERKQEEEEARHKLHEAEEKLKIIKTELADMAPGRQLISFLRQRASAEDYRRHLGLVSLVRRDFKQLSHLLTTAAKDSKNLPDINRIVLYIDDLDRCRSDRVIEVLEAVQLLLAFPLFAVVVAVDPRWLRQSLLDHYPRLLGGVEAERANPRASLGKPATPQDYLEKIFQVPFNLQPMEKSGYETLVNRFFNVNGSESKDHDSTGEKLEKVDEIPPVTPGEQSTDVSETETEKEESQVPPPPTVTDIPPVTPEPATEKPAPRVDPERLVLTQNEINDVQRFHLLFQTPRAVKRLANTYSLIRVGVSETEWPEYLGFNNSAPTYRVPLLLLAVASAFPSLARPWLLWLRATPPSQWQIKKEALDELVANHSDTTEREDWEKLQRCLHDVDLTGWPPPDPKALEKWVPRVVRYSF